MVDHSVMPSYAALPHAPEERTIGAVLVDAGRLSVDDAERILRMQSESKLPFGEAGIRLGVLTQADVDYALSRQFDYGYLVPGQTSISEEVVVAYSPYSPRVEAFRSLRTQLAQRWFSIQPENKSLAIVSAEKREGRSFIAANLAVAFSQLGERTLLIDADLRNPRQHAIFGLDGRSGLSTVLSARAGLDVIQAIPALPNLSVLTAGAIPPNPLELLARPLLPQLLQQLGRKHDVVLLDTPPSAEIADAQVIAVAAGAAVIVARRNAARTWRVQGVSARVAEARVSVVGAVLNDH